jgi:hypothetical protein
MHNNKHGSVGLLMPGLIFRSIYHDVIHQETKHFNLCHIYIFSSYHDVDQLKHILREIVALCVSL